MADYSAGQLITTTPNSPGFGGQSIDSLRRTFGIGDTVHELAPETSIFFSYLSKLGKKPTDETVWKPMEYRSQWQRRNFSCNFHDGNNGADDVAGLKIQVDYNHQGKVVSGAKYSPVFIVPGQVLRINGEVWKVANDATITYITDSTGVTATGEKGTTAGDVVIIASASVVLVSDTSKTYDVTNGSATSVGGQVIGSQWAEASGAPAGWRDELSDVEFFTQIFKTSVPLMSGSMQATRYRGYANEWKRVYGEHVKSHKMDLENAFLFGYGKYSSADVRNSWGIVPFIQNMGGKYYNIDYDGIAPNAPAEGIAGNAFPWTYDGVVDVMDDFMNWESGNSGQKLVLTSRKVINTLHKMGRESFLDNSVGSAGTTLFRSNLEVKSSSFMPVDISSISTSWGSLNFIAHPLFRNDMEDYAVAVDLRHVSLRPLAGNGHSRDTFVETNIQENDIDGRKDQIITEAGLQVLFPETHAILKFGVDND